jgi:WD40 repeat protein
VWNAATGQVIAKLEGHSDDVHRAAFSPDGQRVVTASDDNTARVWNAATGRVIANMPAGEFEGRSEEIAVHRGAPSPASAAFSPDGQRIVTVGRGTEIALILKIVTLDDIDRLLKSK